MANLLTAIVMWLSANLGLPAIHDHPRIELAPPAAMVAVCLGGGHGPVGFGA